jgi:hypothetical protein
MLLSSQGKRIRRERYHDVKFKGEHKAPLFSFIDCSDIFARLDGTKYLRQNFHPRTCKRHARVLVPNIPLK